MMTTLRNFLLLSCLIIFVNLSHAANNAAIPLWGQASYDMSVSDVLININDAYRIPNPKDEPVESALVKVEQIEIAGEQFNAWFIFRLDQLKQVKLTLISPSAKNLNLTELYAKFVKLLSMKYGMPITSKEQVIIPPALPSAYTLWVSGLTNINLKLNNNQLEISYSAEYANDLNKL